YAPSVRKCRSLGRGRPIIRLCFAPVHWFFTVLLIVVTAGTVAVTGYLLHRLFRTDPTSDELPR
ncbi:MAG: hypothetical protein ACRDRH_29945, partial [Pseudonocardia sp.]